LRREPLKILRQFSRKKLAAANKNFGPPLLNRQKPIQLRSKLIGDVLFGFLRSATMREASAAAR
jgi:hypothetical protein